jgi:hypothetical protein
MAEAVPFRVHCHPSALPFAMAPPTEPVRHFCGTAGVPLALLAKLT